MVRAVISTNWASNACGYLQFVGLRDDPFSSISWSSSAAGHERCRRSPGQLDGLSDVNG